MRAGKGGHSGQPITIHGSPERRLVPCPPHLRSSLVFQEPFNPVEAMTLDGRTMGVLGSEMVSRMLGQGMSRYPLKNIIFCDAVRSHV